MSDVASVAACPVPDPESAAIGTTGVAYAVESQMSRAWQ